MIIMAMREKIQGKAGKIFMFFLFMTFFGGIGISNLVMQFLADSDAVVIVNKLPLSHTLFSARVRQEETKLEAFKQKYGKHADIVMRIMGVESDPYATALKVVTYQGIIETAFNQMGLHLSPEYIQLKKSDPYFLQNTLRQQFPNESLDNPLALYQAIQQSPYAAEFERQLLLDIKNDFMLAVIRSGLFVPQLFYGHHEATMLVNKKFAVQTFSLPYFVDLALKNGVKDEQVKKFFEQENASSKRYWVPEKRSATQWTFNPKAYGITVTEDEIADFYTKNKTARFIDAKAQTKVRELALAVTKPEEKDAVIQKARTLQEQAAQNPAGFAALAKEHTTVKSVSDKQNVIDFFAKSATPTEYEKAAFRLKADGDISPVVVLEDKVVILQRVARKEATYKPLAKVKDDIIRLLMDQKFKTVFAKDVSGLIHGSDEAALDAFVKKHNGVKTEFTDKIKPEEATTAEQKLFGIRKVGNMAGFIDDTKGVLIKVTAIERPQSAPFKSVKDTVTQDYFEQEAVKLLQDAVKEAKKAAGVAKKLVPMAGSTISYSGWLSSKDKDAVAQLSSKQGYPTNFIAIDTVGGSLSEVSKERAVVVMLQEIQELKDTSLEQKNELKATVYKEQLKLYIHGFIASLYRAATIKVNEELARTVERQQ